MKIKTLFFVGMCFIIPLFYTCILSSHAVAEEDKGLNAARLYGVYWQNIHVGNIIGEIRTKEGKSEFRVSLHALNIFKTLTRYQNNSFTIINTKTPHSFVPESFELHTVLRKKAKHTRIDYTTLGEVSKEQVSHPANPLKVKPITPEKKQGSVDPLTAALIAREYVRNYLTQKEGVNNQFAITIYDGKYLFDIQFMIKEQTSITFHGRDVPVVHISFLRNPLAGFSTKELQRMKKYDPVIDLYLTNDEFLLPLQAEGTAPLGKATAILQKECASFEECAAGE